MVDNLANPRLCDSVSAAGGLPLFKRGGSWYDGLISRKGQGSDMKHSAFREIGSAAMTSLVFCLIITALFLLLNITNVVGYLNPGNHFHAFPAGTDKNFDRALDLIKDCPFTQQSTLDKWTLPIKLRCEGNYTQKDTQALEEIVRAFNTVKGFPGIQMVESGENVLVSYVDRDELNTLRATYEVTEEDTSFCYHQTKDGRITGGAVVIFCDGLQGYRNSTVLHEFAHLIGFYSHTDQRQSILNTFGPVESLSSTDLLAFRMIYDPAVKPLDTYENIQAYYQTADIAEYSVPGGSESRFPEVFGYLPYLSFAVLLLAFLPVKKGVRKSVMFGRLIAALAVCFLYYYAVTEYLPDDFLSMMLQR